MKKLFILLALLFCFESFCQTPPFTKNTSKWEFLREQWFKDSVFFNVPVTGVPAKNTFHFGTLGQIMDSIASAGGGNTVQKWEIWDDSLTVTGNFKASDIISITSEPFAKYVKFGVEPNGDYVEVAAEGEYIQITANDNVTISTGGNYNNPGLNNPDVRSFMQMENDFIFIENRDILGENRSYISPQSDFLEFYTVNNNGIGFIEISPSTITIQSDSASFESRIRIQDAIYDTEATTLRQVREEIQNTDTSLWVQQNDTMLWKNGFNVLSINGSGVFTTKIESEEIEATRSVSTKSFYVGTTTTSSQSYTLQSDEYLIIANSTTSPVSITADPSTNRHRLIILKNDQPDTTDELQLTDGSTVFDVFGGGGQSRTYISDGSTWHLVSSNGN